MTREILATQTAFIAGLAELAGQYDAILCDVWGVLHNGLSAYDAAAEALMRFRKGGGSVVLISNAPRPGEEVVAMLDRLGVPRTAYDDIVTSGDLTRSVVTQRLGEAVFHIGPARDKPIFAGLPVRFAPLEEADYVVCSGLYDDDADDVDDYREALALMRQRGLLMVCANPDIVVERGDVLVPCAGAIALAYEEMGGEALYTGKPHKPIYEAALARIAQIRGEPVESSRVLAVGDAIRTDIAGAATIGADALFIARGIHTKELGLEDGMLRPESAGEWLSRQTHRPRAALDRLIWESKAD